MVLQSWFCAAALPVVNQHDLVLQRGIPETGLRRAEGDQEICSLFVGGNAGVARGHNFLGGHVPDETHGLGRIRG
uniref:Putative secreted protein n=1 Tax=Anopheles darlingi TaxID=43151 RepID=A0A2M4D9K6_ANODA